MLTSAQRIIPISLILWIFLIPLTTSANFENKSIFQHHQVEKRSVDDALHFFEQRSAVKRYALVEISDSFTSKEMMQKGDQITLNIFEDVNYTARINRAYENVNKTVTLTAGLSDQDGYMILVTTGSRSLGSIYIPSKHLYYKIISDPYTLEHFVIEMDSRDRDILESSPPLIPTELTEREKAEQIRVEQILKDGDLGPDDFANVDVMVLYTPNAESWGDDLGGGIDNVVAAAMANAQLVLDNSEIYMTMTLAHSQRLSFQESGNSGNDLGTFTTSATVQSLRNEHHADLVAVFMQISDTGGIAWLLTNRFGTPSRGVSITRIQQAADGYTHIHEMGHNMGCHHHKLQNFQPGPTFWDNWPDNNYSAGYRWEGTDGIKYNSIMSYSSGSYFSNGITSTEVPYFSSPDIIYQGVAAGHINDANNALTMQQIKHVIAAYRVSGLATIYTAPASSIGLISARVDGEVIYDGGFPVLQKGFVWGSYPNPTLENNSGMSEEGPGGGEFSTLMEDLTPSTDYFVAAYAITEAGTVYGVQRTFRTLQAFMANVTTREPIIIAHSSALAGGDVYSGGNSPVTARGLVWSTNPLPTLDNSDGFSEAGTGTGVFESHLTNLTPETRYYFRAYATNLGGTNYGLQQEFTTLFARIYPNPFLDRLLVEFINNSEKEVTIVLKNTTGQIVKRRPVNYTGDVQEELIVQHLQGGTYLLSIESEIEFPVWRLVKIGNN